MMACMCVVSAGVFRSIFSIGALCPAQSLKDNLITAQTQCYDTGKLRPSAVNDDISKEFPIVACTDTHTCTKDYKFLITLSLNQISVCHASTLFVLFHPSIYTPTQMCCWPVLICLPHANVCVPNQVIYQTCVLYTKHSGEQPLSHTHTHTEMILITSLAFSLILQQ